MRSLVFSAALVFLAACAARPPPMEPPVEEEVPYDGETTANLPDFTNGVIDSGSSSPVDAGPVIVETRCCLLNFSLAAAGEPGDAVGRLVGEAFPLNAGLALTASDGGYVASACLPVNTSTYYWYEFEWPSSDANAGGLSLEDGGFLVQVERYDPDSLHYPSSTGAPRNFIPAVDDCALLDAGTGP